MTVKIMRYTQDVSTEGFRIEEKWIKAGSASEAWCQIMALKNENDLSVWHPWDVVGMWD